MKHKTYFLLLVILQPGCAVELRDRHQQQETLITELKVDKEYTLPVPQTESEQIVLRYDRLVLGPNAQFLIQGLNVRIEVKDLIAEDASIRSFKSDQSSAPGFNGRSGGHLELIVERATGKLNIILQGEKGGAGSTGAEPNESLRGAKGAKGLDALFTKYHGATVISRTAANGDPGGQGQPGFPGEDGFKGGDSGTVLVKITKLEDFALEIQKKPGSGGEGGPGGLGGPGGFGGDPGIETKSWYDGPPRHEYALPGPPGTQGPQGPHGKTGIDGYEEKSCRQLGGEPLICE